MVLTHEHISPETALARRIVVAIPTFNEEDAIEACLASLLTGNEDMQFLVLDGGSEDRTREIVALLAATHTNLSLHHNAKRNQSAAINLAAGRAEESRDILIRCDAHAIYPPRYALSLAEKLIEKGADSVVVPMDAVHRPQADCFERASALIVDTPLGSGGSAHRGGTVSGFVDHGHHAAFWRQRYLDLGGYDEDMLANQDAEYDTRLRGDGGKIWLDANIRLDYFVRRSPRALWRQYWRYGRGRADHIRKHKVRPRLRQMIPVAHIVTSAGSLCLLPFSLLGAVYPVIYICALSGAAVWVSLKKKTLCGAMVPFVLSIMHTAWGLGFLRECLFPMRRHG